MNYMFKGVCPVINVPFSENEEIDFEGLESIIEFSLKQGVKSLCIFAFNSEPHKMTAEEKKRTISFFLEKVNKRAETLVGLIDNSIKAVSELGLTAKAGGADAVILYPPALSTPSGGNLLNYFKTIADTVGLPVMIQDNPRSTGVTMSTEFLLEAFNTIESFNYLKVECPIATRKMKELTKLTDGKLKCYSGNGGIFAIDAFLSGAWGIMPGITIANKFIRLYDLMENGEVSKARDLFEKILPFVWFEDQSMEFYISCEKEILKRKGVIKNAAARKPACLLSQAEKDELIALYRRL